MKINTQIPVDFSDPMTLKDKALELQNYLGYLGEFTSGFTFMVEQIDVELSKIKDQSLVQATKDVTGNLEYKKSYGKLEYRYLVEITFPFVELREKESIKGEYNFYELSRLRSLYEYKLNRAKNKFFEVKSAIEVCNFYPVKSFS